MPTTQLTEFTGSIDTIAARTDDAGTAVTDWAAEERRMAFELFTPGVIPTVADAWKANAGGGGTMNVIVGSGAAKVDLALVPGQMTGQGQYLVRLDEVTKTLTHDAADPSQQRIDEIYLVVYDNLYDSSARSLPRLAIRKGDVGAAAPGPDAAWEAYLLLAEVVIPSGAADITEATINDKREAINLAGGGGQAGDIKMTGRASAPLGWLLCNGAAVSRTQYARLFAAIGTAFGVGDGSTTFNLPDMRQRMPLGKSASGAGQTLGETGGQVLHTHSGPSHTHTGPSHTHTNPSTGSGGSHAHSQGSTGSSTVPHTHQLVYNTVGSSHGFHRSTSDGVSGKRHKLDGNGNQSGEDTNNGTGSSHNHSLPNTNSGGAHTHSVGNTGSSGTGNTGASGTGNTGSAGFFPPYVSLNFVIKY